MADLADIQVTGATVVAGKLTLKKKPDANWEIVVPGSALSTVGQEILLYIRDQDHDATQLQVEQEHLQKPWKFEVLARYLGPVAKTVVLSYAVVEPGGGVVKRSKPVDLYFEYT